MDFENSSLNSFYTSNDQDNHFKCDICTLTFRTPSVRNEHILNHLRKTTCSVCDEMLIQIGDIWYSPHEHTNHTRIKDEVIPDDLAERLIKPLNYTENGVENIDPLHAKQEVSYEDENIDENTIEKITENQNDAEYQSETESFAETVDKMPIDNVDVPNYVEEEQSEETTSKKPFGICGVCRKSFSSPNGLKYHMNIHLGLPPFKCGFCDKEYLGKRNRDKHQKSHRKQTKISGPAETTKSDWTMEMYNNYYMCKLCRVAFLHQEDLMQHEKLKCGRRIIEKNTNPNLTSDKQKKIECDICHKQFTRKCSLRTHMNIHFELKPHQCEICNKGFRHISNLYKHRRSYPNKDCNLKATNQENEESVRDHDETSESVDALESSLDAADVVEGEIVQHSTEQAHTDHTLATLSLEKPEACTIKSCRRTFRNVRGLYAHIKAHHPDEVKRCNECPKYFFQESELAEHKKSEHEIMFACNVCSEEFVRYSLIEHIAQKHGKMLICRFKDCNQCFKDHQSLAFHSMQHPESEKPRLVCPTCGKKVCRSAFKGHMNSHIGATPHTCKECGKSFARPSSLLRHNMSHTGRKPYVCNIDDCVRAFRDSVDLKRHKFSIHKIYSKKHTCSICSKIFPENKILTKHMRSVHGISNSSQLTN